MPPSRFFYRDAAAPEPTQPLSLGVVALIEREGAMLLERRVDSGRWGLVGGAVEMNDSLEAALRREVLEETGLTVSRFSLYGTFSDPSRLIRYPQGDVVRIVTLAYVVEVEDFGALRLSDESTELRFFPVGELSPLDIVETHCHIVDAFLTQPPVVLA
jgi:8-oxo-dGTP pyrophosphatase MutT (NUDIX family)